MVIRQYYDLSDEHILHFKEWLLSHIEKGVGYNITAAHLHYEVCTDRNLRYPEVHWHQLYHKLVNEFINRGEIISYSKDHHTYYELLPDKKRSLKIDSIIY